MLQSQINDALQQSYVLQSRMQAQVIEMVNEPMQLREQKRLIMVLDEYAHDGLLRFRHDKESLQIHWGDLIYMRYLYNGMTFQVANHENMISLYSLRNSMLYLIRYVFRGFNCKYFKVKIKWFMSGFLMSSIVLVTLIFALSPILTRSY